MFIFYDYLYYGIYKIYSNANDSSSEFASVSAVSGVQAFNILSLIFLYDIMFEKNGEINVSKLVAVLVFFVLVVINYIKYIRISKFSHTKIKEKWDQKTSQQKIFFRVLLAGYVTTSAVLFFGLIAYFASKKM